MVSLRYINYKHFFSILLIALFDANCKFIWASVGHSGREHESDVWEQSDFAVMIEDGTANIPSPTSGFNYQVVADDAFKLGPHLRKG